MGDGLTLHPRYGLIEDRGTAPTLRTPPSWAAMLIVRRAVAAGVGRAVALAHRLEANFSRIEELYAQVLQVRGEAWN